MTATASARLLRAILADPADDTARLAYSDALEEEGQDRLANFVRRQMVGEPVTPALMALIPFEGILECQPHQTVRVAEARQATVTAPSGAALVWRRGFVVEVSCTAADFIRHAAALFAAHPVERVTLTDREPDEYGQLYWWTNCYRGGMGYEAASDLPDCIYLLLSSVVPKYPSPAGLRGGSSIYDMRRRGTGFATREAALDALVRTCVAYGRRLAGLPALD